MNYCTRDDIEDLFGPLNVAKWADLDNSQVAETIAARIERAIAVATDRIDSRLRNGPYRLPVSNPQETLVNLCAQLAGVWLYESRGVQDFSPETGLPMHRLRWHVEKAEETINDLLSGKLRLESATVGTGTTAPIVVND